jgi:hypothetical protein
LVEPVPRSTLLAELARKEVRPQGVNFVSIELKSRPLETPQAAPPSDLEKARRAEQGLPAAKAPTMDVTVDLVGTAATDADVSAYMAALQKSPLLTGVTLLYSEEFRKNKEDPALRRFNFEMHINPEAGLRVGGVATALPKN